MIRRASEELGWKKFCEAMRIPATTDRKVAVQSLLACAYQGTKNSSVDTLQSAESLALSLGAQFYSWQIDDEVNQ